MLLTQQEEVQMNFCNLGTTETRTAVDLLVTPLHVVRGHSGFKMENNNWSIKIRIKKKDKVQLLTKVQWYSIIQFGF